MMRDAERSPGSPGPLGMAGAIARSFIDSKLTPLVILFSVALGALATVLLPREEEPQIVVPMIDVFVELPGASPREVEARVTTPLEKLLWEVEGVEYIYSTSSPGRAMVIVRFLVGEDEEDAIVRLNQKLLANAAGMPSGASPPLVQPRTIDDVPILAVTLSSAVYDDVVLRRLAAELHDDIAQVDDVSTVDILGGQRREVLVELDPTRLAAYDVTPLEVAARLRDANQRLASGDFETGNRQVVIETGRFLRSRADVEAVVVAVRGGRSVHLGEVADVVDGGEEPTAFVRFASPADPAYLPAVTLAVSKRKGANATTVAERVLEKVELVRARTLPADVTLTVTRNYGETAREKSDELLYHMTIAIVAVSILIWLTLGFRESWIVFIAIPVTLALTLVVFYLYGYTLNRITLFALIFSIGLLVDDAIVVVENVVRHLRMPGNRARSLADVAVEAVSEVGNPTVLATFTVIAAVLPMAFVRGLMGPYMRPIPVGASTAMAFSLLVAFVVTPWAAIRFLRAGPSGHSEAETEDRLTQLYRVVMGRLIGERSIRRWFLAGVVLLLVGSLALVAVGLVTVKMLPFDNKSEFQVIIEMPEGTTLEQTARVARALADPIREEPEVVNLQTYVGLASPYNFNGLVRHYFLRRGAHVADIQVNLVEKGERALQSHDIAKRIRDRIEPIASRWNARIQVSEVPPGPPVLQTLVAEIYGPTLESRISVADRVREIFETTDGVVDVDWMVEHPQDTVEVVIDDAKAAPYGISQARAASVLRLASSGETVGVVHVASEKEDVPLRLRLSRASRSDPDRLRDVRLRAVDGALVPLGELATMTASAQERSIYHKNLMPVTYVTADLAGAAESPVYAILDARRRIDDIELPDGSGVEQLNTRLPFAGDWHSLKWDGEWHITYEVFRDLGLAFAVVLILIYVLVVGWFQSFTTPLIIMSAIPFSLVGILPAHWLMGSFFTATSMIGFIAGAGIVVRNSIILVDFIELRRAQGMPLDRAVIDAGAVRFRPMALTAAAVVVGASVILFDPIFQGLAISLMAGEVASLLLSRMTVPIVYSMYGEDRTRVPDAPVPSTDGHTNG